MSCWYFHTWVEHGKVPADPQKMYAWAPGKSVDAVTKSVATERRLFRLTKLFESKEACEQDLKAGNHSPVVPRDMIVMSVDVDVNNLQQFILVLYRDFERRSPWFLAEIGNPVWDGDGRHSRACSLLHGSGCKWTRPANLEGEHKNSGHPCCFNFGLQQPMSKASLKTVDIPVDWIPVM